MKVRAEPINKADMVTAIGDAEEIVNEAIPLMTGDVAAQDLMGLRAVAFSHVLLELLTYESE